MEWMIIEYRQGSTKLGIVDSGLILNSFPQIRGVFRRLVERRMCMQVLLQLEVPDKRVLKPFNLLDRAVFQAQYNLPLNLVIKIDSLFKYFIIQILRKRNINTKRKDSFHTSACF